MYQPIDNTGNIPNMFQGVDKDIILPLSVYQI